MPKQIRWNQSVNLHASSKCERFRIVPLFGEGEKPVEYQLWFRNEKAGLHPTQRDAKNKANAMREIRPGESLCHNALDGRHIYDAVGKNTGMSCVRCSRLRVDIERKL